MPQPDVGSFFAFALVATSGKLRLDVAAPQTQAGVLNALQSRAAGLLSEPERTLGGRRVYPPEAVTVLRVIKATQRLGFTLDEISDLLDVGHHRHSHRTRRCPRG